MSSEPDLILCWGNCQDGQIGTKICDETNYIPPRAFEMPLEVKKVVCGGKHTILITSDGMAYSAGRNDYGQLGRQGIRGRYERIVSLETKLIVDAACGANHTLILDSQGTVFGFGSNHNGQLGTRLGCESQQTPKRLFDAAIRIVYIACGNNNSFVLNECGQLYIFGSNSCGQGLVPVEGSNIEDSINEPRVDYLNIVKICVGASHVVALTFNGFIYVWGSNTKYQCGLGARIATIPNVTIVYQLNEFVVVDIGCGANHTAVVTEDGRVFTFGDGSKGQLGNCCTLSEHIPFEVNALQDVKVSKVFCGRESTLVYAEESNCFYTFGSHGILYHNYTMDSLVPRRLKIENSAYDISHYFPHSASSSTDHTIILIKPRPPKLDPPNVYPHALLSYGNGTVKHSDYMTFLNLDVSQQNQLLADISLILLSIPCNNASFLRSDHFRWGHGRHNIDFEMLDDFCNRVILYNHSQIILEMLDQHFKQHQPTDTIDINRYVYILLYVSTKIKPLEGNSPFPKWIMTPRIKYSQFSKDLLLSSFRYLPPSLFINILETLKEDFLECFFDLYSTSEGQDSSEYRNMVLDYFELFDALHDFNKSTNLVHYSQFYFPNIDNKLNIILEYLDKFDNSSTETIFHLPYMLDPYIKAIAIFIRRFMHTVGSSVVMAEKENWTIETMEQKLGETDQEENFYLTVHRSSLYEDAAVAIRSSENIIQKNLLVEFVDEQAMDHGGVRKEFFFLLFQHIFDPDQQKDFNLYPESQLFWFPEHMASHPRNYAIIGFLMGLALYNGVIEQFNFPLAFYKKLLNVKVTFEDLEELDPILAKNMSYMLDYVEDDFEDIFDLTFEVTRNVFGVVKTVSLIQDGSQIRVTQENKLMYVEAFIEYLFNRSCQKEFFIFMQNFYRCDFNFIKDFVNAYELRELMVGSSNYDFTDLQEFTHYRDPAHEQHPTVIMFWQVFYELSLEQKKKFLQFVTGTDKLPIRGFSSLFFTITLVNTGEQSLPCSHTCFNLLDLPIYSTKEILREKLTLAIENCVGFAFI